MPDWRASSGGGELAGDVDRRVEEQRAERVARAGGANQEDAHGKGRLVPMLSLGGTIRGYCSIRPADVESRAPSPEGRGAEGGRCGADTCTPHRRGRRDRAWRSSRSGSLENQVQAQAPSRRRFSRSIRSGPSRCPTIGSPAPPSVCRSMRRTTSGPSIVPARVEDNFKAADIMVGDARGRDDEAQPGAAAARRTGHARRRSASAARWRRRCSSTTRPAPW